MITRRISSLLGAALLFLCASTAHAVDPTHVYTALGASDVNGFGATNPATEGYVPLIATWMNERAPSGVTYTLSSRGVNGYVAPDIANTDTDPDTPGTQTTLSGALSDSPKVVTLWIGANDVLHIASPSTFPTSPYNVYTPGQVAQKVALFAASYNTIISQLKTIPDVQIVTANIPKLGDAYLAGLGHAPNSTETNNAAALNGLALQITNQINTIAGNNSVPVVDLYNDTTTFAPGDLAADGHFNTSGYAKLAKLFERKLQDFSLFDLLVTTLGDTTDGADDLLSLREAITSANSRSGADTIRFQSGLTGTITLGSALPNLSTEMTIQGPGAASLTVARGAAGNYSVFQNLSTATISGLTITNGSYSFGGGGIRNQSDLTLTNCVVTGNSAPANNGGGLLTSGTAHISGCTFSDNHAGSAGGAISTSGTTTIENSTISGNDLAGLTGYGAFGGGIDAIGSLTITGSTVSGNTAHAADGATFGYGGGIHNGGTLEIDSSTISGNTAEGEGGGIRNQTSDSLTITNSTISGNSVTGTGSRFGGGINNGSGTLTLTNSTLANNNGNTGAGLFLNSGSSTVHNSTIAGNTAAQFGGGVFNSAATLKLQNSIIASNTATAILNIGPGTYTDEGYNFIDGDPKFVLDTGKPSLTNNGGPTATIALDKGSTAVNAGDPSVLAGADTDQRGTGFPRVRGGRLDIGAFEVQDDAPVADDLSQVIKPGAASLTLGLGASDPEDDTLTYIVVTPPTHGSLGSFTDNKVVYTPDGTFAAAGSDSFTFKVNDGYIDSNTATVNIKANGAPTIISLIPAKADDSVVGTGGTSATGEQLKLTLKVSDEDGASQLRAAYVTLNGALSNANGIALSYDFPSNKLYLRSNDGQITLGGLAPGAPSTVENDFGILDASQSTVVKNGNEATITFYVTPKTTFVGAKKLWGSVKDSSSAQVNFTQFATWTVNKPAPPVSHVAVSDLTRIIKPGETSIKFTLPVTNPDGMLLTYTIVDTPDHGTATVNASGTVTYTPDGTFTGLDTFTYKVNDGYADSSTATVTIKYNSAPVLTDVVPAKADNSVVGSGGTSLSDEPLKLTLTASDEDGAGQIRAVYATFNKALSNSGGIVLSYDVPSNKLYLRSSDGKTTLGGQTPGSAGTVENDYGILDFAASTVLKSGNDLTVTFAITPKASFTGLKKVWGSVKDSSGLQTAYTQTATWTVNPAPVLRVKPAANKPSARGS